MDGIEILTNRCIINKASKLKIHKSNKQMLQETPLKPNSLKIPCALKNFQRHNASSNRPLKQDPTIRWTILELNTKNSKTKICYR